ncbi:NAD(P)/FAD-dependent oxidoreductase [Microvirga brassicacearum]|uniref:NAD(P)/FAD-dependent oxidoreductase n=1 Tax=Microvirga brassicacearum TaxID=2580413 RepID=UPI0019117482|nr:FAD-binding oxidoreductase [Microvirga brassicacearum]
MHIKKLPRDDRSCGWYQLLPDPKPARTLSGRQSADWVVVGAGFVGLAAARRVAALRPNDRIMLIEALRIGQGASGRNSGFVIDLPHKRDLENLDVGYKSKVMRLNEAAISSLEDAVQRHGIDCQWSRAGRYQAAVGSRGLEYLTTYKTLLDNIGHPYRWLDRSSLASVLGTSYYEAAIHIPTGILMQPAALVRGLGETLPPNVEVYEQSPITKIDRSAGRIELSTSQGSVVTPQLLLGTNVFSAEFGFLRQRMVPVMTFASITRPLTSPEMESYGGADDWGLTPADHAGTTMRFTSDRRLLIRNQHRFVPDYTGKADDITIVRQNHRKGLIGRYPWAKDVEFEHTWGGICGMSRNYAAFFGKIGDGVYASACHQAVGAARGTISGQLLADLATGQDSQLLSDMADVSGMPALNPPQPFLGVGVRARMKYAAWASRSER